MEFMNPVKVLSAVYEGIELDSGEQFLGDNSEFHVGKDSTFDGALVILGNEKLN